MITKTFRVGIPDLLCAKNHLMPPQLLPVLTEPCTLEWRRYGKQPCRTWRCPGRKELGVAGEQAVQLGVAFWGQ